MYALRVLVAVLLLALPVAGKAKPPKVCGDEVIYTFDEAGWLLSGGAAIDGAFGYQSASVALNITKSATPGVGAIFEPPSVIGQTYTIRSWVNADAANADNVLEVVISTGVDIVASFTLTKAQIGAGWQLYEFGSFTNTAYDPVNLFLGIAVQTGTDGGTWVVDDVEIDEEVVQMALSKRTAISNAVDVLKAITGSGEGYNSNLGGRVYTRLFTPAEQPDVALPYCGLPLDQEAERLEYEGFAFTSVWRMVGHAFFSDNPESDKLDSQGSMDAAKFRDDLIRAFMLDQTLGGQTENCEVTAIDTASGVIDDGIAEVIFTIEFTQIGGSADLEAA